LAILSDPIALLVAAGGGRFRAAAGTARNSSAAKTWRELERHSYDFGCTLISNFYAVEATHAYAFRPRIAHHGFERRSK
jgi:hypothetical protein